MSGHLALVAMMATSTETGDRQDTKRLESKKQTLDDAYAAPANFLEIDVVNPETHGVGKKRYTDYEVRMRVGTFVNLRLVKNIYLPEFILTHSMKSFVSHPCFSDLILLFCERKSHWHMSLLRGSIGHREIRVHLIDAYLLTL